MENLDKYQWQCLPISTFNKADIVEKYFLECSCITENGFGGKARLNQGDFVKALANSDIFCILVEAENPTCFVGFAFCVMPPKLINGQTLFWVNKICIARKMQGKGYGIEKLLTAVTRMLGLNIGYVGCKTQNPYLLKKLEHVAQVCYPFHRSFYADDDDQLGILLIATAIIFVPQVRISFRATLEGLGFLEVPPGILRDEYGASIAPDVDYALISEYPTEKYLQKNNFRRENGDCVVVISKLK